MNEIVMKKYIVLSLIVVLLVACGKEPLNQDGQNELVKVSLNIAGEIMFEDNPLTKAESDDMLLGINILSGNHKSYGLFDKKDGIDVYLEEGYQYTIECAMIMNGKEVVSHHSPGANYPTQYYSPFYLRQGTSSRVSELENTMVYDAYYLLDLTYATSYVSGHKNDADRYYGKITGYTPEVNGTINLNLIHTVVGAKYILSGLTDGSVDLTIKRGNDVFFQTTLTSDVEGEGKIFECSNITNAWQYASTYKETASVSIVWHRGNGVTQDLGSVEVDLLRNRMNVININLGSDDGNAHLGINTESASMSSESVTVNVQ